MNYLFIILFDYISTYIGSIKLNAVSISKNKLHLKNNFNLLLNTYN